MTWSINRHHHLFILTSRNKKVFYSRFAYLQVVLFNRRRFYCLKICHLSKYWTRTRHLWRILFLAQDEQINKQDDPVLYDIQVFGIYALSYHYWTNFLKNITYVGYLMMKASKSRLILASFSHASIIRWLQNFSLRKFQSI